jgi:hypothetical protein
MFIELFFKLLIGHAVADYALQPPNIALGKNRHAGPPKEYNEAIHGKRQPIWVMVMAAHTLIHAGAVWVITADPVLAFWQFLTHYAIDTMKCERWFNVWIDQALHVAVLAATALIANAGGF